MLHQKYECDKKFSILIQLIGEMNDSIYIITQVAGYQSLSASLAKNRAIANKQVSGWLRVAQPPFQLTQKHKL